MNIFYLFIIVFFYSQSLFAGGERCLEPTSQREMNYCAEIELESILKKFELQSQKISSAFLKSKIEGANELFEKSITHSRQYVESHCESASQIYHGGSLHHYAGIQCKVNLYRKLITINNGDYKDTLNILDSGAP